MAKYWKSIRTPKVIRRAFENVRGTGNHRHDRRVTNFALEAMRAEPDLRQAH